MCLGFWLLLLNTLGRSWKETAAGLGWSAELHSSLSEGVQGWSALVSESPVNKCGENRKNGEISNRIFRNTGSMSMNREDEFTFAGVE